MDDCGEIFIRVKKEEDLLVLSVEDNGIGMSEEEVSLLLTDSNRKRKHGSGVGLVNINNRLQILFGKEYGLFIESEPDEGTRVSIRIPAIPYTENNRKILEKGYLFSKEEIEKKEMQGKCNEK